MKRLLLQSVFFFSVLFASCDDANGPSRSFSGTIEYELSGGFAGGIRTSLTVDPLGHVVLHSSYPPLEDNLTISEQAALESYFADIWTQPDTLRGGCADDVTHLIQWTDTKGTKTVVVDGCALNLHTGNPPWPTLSGIVRTLGSIADRIYERKAPWRGIEGIFNIDKVSYGLDEPIRLSYRLKNPTAQERRLLFHHADHFWFSVDRYNFPGFHYFYPMRAFYPWAFPDSSSPSILALNPGEEKELAYTWDHSVVDFNGKSDVLNAGNYHVRMGMLAGDFTAQDFDFDLYDKSLPIKGDIVPDWQGGSRSSTTYTFQLTATNWTQSAVTLHFRNGQRIAVELWDLDVNPPTTVIYRTEISSDNDPQTLVLAAGAKVVFAETVEKVKMGPSYIWTLAKVRLLCTDFEFTREGQLEIIR